ncbi:hypothetical protein L2E82_10572 [Cichorium intybus]|uniref:Uncharacterized protein n=1 Tax=Cichorium intybus TaxID=13427 RepID=A0ACB9GBZ3_CICIN|nr:hypothetical protein L2E82_10572 [Cichorium intybus]
MTCMVLWIRRFLAAAKPRCRRHPKDNSDSTLQAWAAGVSVFLGGNKPSRVGNARGDISVNFSCDPGVALALGCVDLALDEIKRLQEEGPSDTNISMILEIEQRAQENGLQLALGISQREL